MESTPLIIQFTIKVKSATGKDFQNLIAELFELYYKPNDFIAIRDTKDDGCDGIIKSENKIIACYGPESYYFPDFKKKANSDFKKYEQYWKRKYSNWEMVVNHELSPDEMHHIDSLGINVSIIGLKQIITIIEHGLTSGQRRALAKKLNIDNDFMAKDYIKELLDALLISDTVIKKNMDYKQPMYIEDKIRLNYDENDIEEAKEDYYLSLNDFPKIRDILSTYEETSIASIKIRIRTDFSLLPNSSFKTRINLLAKQYHEKISSLDDDCLRFSKSLILYCFEQCIIGKRTDTEQKC